MDENKVGKEWSPQERENVAVVERVLRDVWSEQRLELLPALYAPDFVAHFEHATTVGIEEWLERLFKPLLRGIPDVSVAADGFVPNGDTVVCRWTARGTHRGVLLGVAPTHEPLTISGTLWAVLKNGRLVESWTHWDMRYLLQSLRQERDELTVFYQALFDQSAPAVVLDVGMGRIYSCNSKFSELVGYAHEELIGMHISNLDVNETADETLSHVAQVLREGKDLFETTYQTKQGTLRELLISACHIQVQEREFIQAVFADLTAKKQAEREREALLAKLEKALAEVKTLRGILPTCAYCRKIRLEGADEADPASWVPIESYISKHSDAQFSHGICPDCLQEVFGEEAWQNYMKKRARRGDG